MTFHENKKQLQGHREKFIIYETLLMKCEICVEKKVIGYSHVYVYVYRSTDNGNYAYVVVCFGDLKFSFFHDRKYWESATSNLFYQISNINKWAGLCIRKSVDFHLRDTHSVAGNSESISLYIITQIFKALHQVSLLPLPPRKFAQPYWCYS